jgi:hypothetical protein
MALNEVSGNEAMQVSGQWRRAVSLWSLYFFSFSGWDDTVSAWWSANTWPIVSALDDG